MRRWGIIFLLVYALSAASMTHASAIYGGASALGDARVVGFVESRNSNTTLCSGALISSRVAVSVAHCFLNRRNLLAISPGAKASGEREVFTIREVIFVPGYFTNCGDLSNPENVHKCTLKDDFVFVLFHNDVIPNYEVPIATKGDVEGIKNQQKPLVLFGYGFTSSLRDLTGYPKKLNSKAGIPLIWTDRHLLPPEEKVLMFTEELKNSVCTGDSGGPVYSEDKIVSVINTGNGCGPTEVANGGMSTPIYQYLYLLEEAEARAATELKAKQEAEARAAAEQKAKQEAEAAALAAAAKSKKTTITCVKGKFTERVTAVKPKCPKGYKKK